MVDRYLSQNLALIYSGVSEKTMSTDDEGRRRTRKRDNSSSAVQYYKQS